MAESLVTLDELAISTPAALPSGLHLTPPVPDPSPTNLSL